MGTKLVLKIQNLGSGSKKSQTNKNQDNRSGSLDEEYLSYHFSLNQGHLVVTHH